MDNNTQEFKFKRSSIARFYLTVFIFIFMVFFYFSITHSIMLGQLITVILLTISIYFLLYQKTVVIDSNERSITVFIGLFGVTISKTGVQRIPLDAVVQCIDEYQTQPRGAICWLSVDVKESKGDSVLPLPLQKKMKEHSNYNRKILVNIASYISKNMRLQLQDLRSARYRD